MCSQTHDPSSEELVGACRHHEHADRSILAPERDHPMERPICEVLRHRNRPHAGTRRARLPVQ
ncbi:hypothetical protein BST32_13550 [Mycobacteroides abscessus subsp. massiliense]|nr:hypothetical protein BST32_13550 [Mycobacteroides abscessus subsp. massiliense]